MGLNTISWPLLYENPFEEGGPGAKGENSPTQPLSQSNAPDGPPTNYQLIVWTGSGTNSLNQFVLLIRSWWTGPDLVD